MNQTVPILCRVTWATQDRRWPGEHLRRSRLFAAFFLAISLVQSVHREPARVHEDLGGLTLYEALEGVVGHLWVGLLDAEEFA